MGGETTPNSAREPSRKAVAFGAVVVLILIGIPIGVLLDATRNSEPTRRSALAGVEKSCMDHKDRPDHRGELVRTKTFGAESLTCARFRDARLEDVVFDGSLLTLSDFRDAQLIRVLFRDAKLTFANFQGALLRDVRFVGSNLFSATFTGADEESVTTTDTTCPDGDEMGRSCRGHGVDDPE
jgi:uncharacterized protein YjbI with pentapeptide repeats